MELSVVHISKSDTSGGAARAAFRLHSGLLDCGYDSSMYVVRRYSDDPTVIAFRPPMNPLRRMLRRLRKERIRRSFAPYRSSRPDGYDLFSDDRSQHGDAPFEQLPSCDVVNLHWISGFIDCRSFFTTLPPRTPVVWTLHDMNAFTGGCHYDIGCGKYTCGCGACPQLGSTDPTDLSSQIWNRKEVAFEQVEPQQLHLVTPSTWLMREVERASFFSRFPTSVIPYGIDVETFRPRERGMARDLLGVPYNARVVLFVAESVSKRRKGFATLARALRDLSDVSDLFLLSLGEGTPAVDSGIPHVHLGFVDGDRRLSLIYSAVDLFVIPSLQDNLPNTVLEAMACGTPVVGFDAGGIPDMVRPGVTGLLAPSGDVSALRDRIADVLTDSNKRMEMSAQCRRVATEEYASEVQARRYAELYETAVAQHVQRVPSESSL